VKHLIALSNTALAVALAATGCARSDDAPQASAVASTAGGARAVQGCEMWVDKVAPRGDSHGVYDYDVFLKIDQSLVDAGVKRIGFEGIAHDVRNECASSPFLSGCDALGREERVSAFPFAGSRDYFQLGVLTVRNDFTYEHRWQGAFVVELNDGRTLTMKAPDGGDLFLDANGLDELDGRLRSVGAHRDFAYDVSEIPTTAALDYRYLNKNACR
jgi:hypothetical protein